MDELQKVIATLTDALGNLAAALAPVMLPENPSPTATNEESDGPQQSELRRRVEHQRNQLMQVISHIEELNGRLDIPIDKTS